jgi:hypothetical protein
MENGKLFQDGKEGKNIQKSIINNSSQIFLRRKDCETHYKGEGLIRIARE